MTDVLVQENDWSVHSLTPRFRDDALEAAYVFECKRRDIGISMRAGIHIGPVVVGVIGRSKFVYDLWGDSVNVASRMESTAPFGEIQVTEVVQSRMNAEYAFAPRGVIEVKGKGEMQVWLLKGRT